MKRFRDLVLRLAWRVREVALAAPILVKILGIGVMVGLLFGVVTYFTLVHAVSGRLHELLESQTRRVAETLAIQVEQAFVLDDLVTLQSRVKETLLRLPDTRYIILRHARGRIAAHTLGDAMPAELAEAPPLGFRVLDSGEGRLFEYHAPILGGAAGSLQLALGDRMVREEVRFLRLALLMALSLSAFIGMALGLWFAQALTRPIHALGEATKLVGRGQSAPVLPVVFRDEVGELTRNFNAMAANLESYRLQVEEKERARKALLEKLVNSQEAERAAISRELHDQLGQSLSALRLRLHALRGGAGEEQRADLEARVAGMIDEVRRLAWGMRPSILDDSGLDLAIHRLVEDFGARQGLAVDYQFLGGSSVRLPSRIELAFYRLAQEALTNVLRHSGAKEASVVVWAGEGQGSIVIEDTGRGIEAAPSARSQGIGLPGMRERIEALGGVFSVESTPGKGTAVAARVHWS